ncbi:MAG: hypothetical protein KF845_12955 [Cyclobacteriaceae bacterium]|nr:hypothetical protein [Cyclobacteriaceae bacterium]
MIILIDLDGTLTDTAHERFKPFKDGLQETVIENIPIFRGAKQFIINLINAGHKPIILSDSHPKYVNKIAQQIFQIPAISLTDKPNVEKTLNYINSNPEIAHLFTEKDNFMIVGDSWLDIEIGRRLNIRTVLTQFYQASSIEERDGIGQDWKPIKMGPTYYAKSFDELFNIIQRPIENLLAIEAIFHNQNSSKAVKFLHRPYSDGFATFRCLARQEDGECDKYARADKYYQIDNPNRSEAFLNSLAQATSNYLSEVASFQNLRWDYFTYVSDKKTTNPPNKMKEIFDLVNSPFPKIKLFEWNENVTGSLRNQPNYEARRSFIANNLHTVEGIELQNKNIIVLDDQFTSSATANEICTQLRNKGVKKILFIALFYLILPVVSKACPQCGKPLKIKIRRNDGNRFYSCLPAKFGGQGCGYTENIA